MMLEAGGGFGTGVGKGIGVEAGIGVGAGIVAIVLCRAASSPAKSTKARDDSSPE
jgi:hypothetical protein